MLFISTRNNRKNEENKKKRDQNKDNVEIFKLKMKLVNGRYEKIIN